MPHHLELEQWIGRNLYDAVPTAISVIGRDYRIVDANARFEQQFGEWEGKRCYEVYKGRMSPCLRCGMLETFVDGQVRDRQEVGVITNGHSIDYLCHIVPLVRSNGDIPYVFEM